MKQYQFIKELGSGSFGRVSLVRRHDNPHELLAMKQIKMSQLTDKQKDGALNETRLLASIDSPNVIEYKTAFFDDYTNSLCIVMEYADGGDLETLIKKKAEKGQKFNENFIWQVFHDILKGLKILHAHNILHRDLKPGNIFFVDGVAKLGDMNISKVMESSFATTQAGTPYYTSPEIWNGEYYGNKCDIWSLGCLIYEIAMLRPPFVANDFPTLNKKIQIGYYEQLPIIYSKKLCLTLKKCLAVRAQERPSTVELLKDSVFQFMQNKDEGEINLISQIKCPKVLRAIKNQLPTCKSSKKIPSMKSIQPQNRAVRSKTNIHKMMTPDKNTIKIIHKSIHMPLQFASNSKNQNAQENLTDRPAVHIQVIPITNAQGKHYNQCEFRQAPLKMKAPQTIYRRIM